MSEGEREVSGRISVSRTTEDYCCGTIAAVVSAFARGEGQRVGVHLIVAEAIATHIDGGVNGLHERLGGGHPLAGNIVGSAVVGRGAHDVKSRGEVHPVVHRTAL